MPKEVWNIAGQFGWHDYEEPPLAEGQVRIRSQFSAAKHGTELAFWDRAHGGSRGRYDKTYQVFLHDKAQDVAAPVRKGPQLLDGRVGNMTVGTVSEVGPGVSTLGIGDRVLIYGGFRETHVQPEGLCWKIPADMPWQSAVCLDSADFALGAIRDGHVRTGDAVAIFGLGAIGLMAIQLAKVGGAHPVIALDPLAGRRDLAMRLGADLALDPANTDAGLEIKKATGTRGADVVLDYSSNVRAMQAALRGVAYGGTVVAGSFPPPYPAGLDLGAEAHRNIPTIVFSRSCSEPNRDSPRWNESRIMSTCLRLLTEGRITGVPVVTPIVRFQDAPAEYPSIATQPDKYIKLGVTY